jgi:2,3-bisphosphoglycerate-dependent phosphoglycerate mutase
MWHLSGEGKRRAEELAHAMVRFRPEGVLSSPEARARETASLLAGTARVPEPVVVDDLREHDDGDSPFTNEKEFHALVSDFFARSAARVFGPESADDAYARFAGAIATACEAAPDEDRSLLFVTHGRVMSLFVARTNDVPAFDFWKSLRMPSYVVLGVPGYRLQSGEFVAGRSLDPR